MTRIVIAGQDAELEITQVSTNTARLTFRAVQPGPAQAVPYTGALDKESFGPTIARGTDTDAFKWYTQGKLPPARIHLRAQRRAVKLFLAHFHEVLYWTYYETLPPNPYVLDHVPGHVHRLENPNVNLLLPQLYEAKLRAQHERSRKV